MKILSDRSSTYKFWWRISIKCSTKWFRWVERLKNKEILLRIIPNTLFCEAKIKKGKEKKKRKSFKAETVKSLSTRSKCYCFRIVYCFIPERLHSNTFSVPWPLHIEMHFTSTVKSSINMCSSSPKAYKSEVRAGWYFLLPFITGNDLVF